MARLNTSSASPRNPDEQHISRVIDRDGLDERYCCACELAQMVRIDVEDS